MSERTPDLLGGRYEVGDLIGRGGMAEVHRGYDTRLGRPVAIKILRSDHARDASFIHRFRREAQSVAGLNHPAIVAVYDSGEDHLVESGGAEVAVPYIVMEFVEGQTLRHLLNEHGTLAPDRAARITEGVLDALAYSHRMGIVHRDIKPANVMVTEDGAVKVMDFGIARAIADAQATMTQTATVIGTAQYLSPEQAEGQTVDARSDLYSTGCLLFELLAGRTPFTGDPISLSYQHVGKPPPLPSSFNDEVYSALDAVVLHALSKNKDERYQDAAAFRADLRAARIGLPISDAARASLTAADSVAGAALAGGAAGALGGERTQVIPTEDRRPQPPPPDGDTADQEVVGEDGGRRRGAWAWVGIVLALLAALGLLAFATSRYMDSRQPTMVSVPDVTGLQQKVAQGRLTSQGFDVNVDEAANDSTPDGNVISQDPKGNSRAQENSTVTITVSTGPGNTSVPSLEGRSESDARAALDEAGLKVGSTSEVDNPDYEKGTVVSSDPAGGATVSRGSTVDLELASGKVDLPDLTGLTESDARSKASDLGLDVSTETKPSDKQSGTVIGQDPGPGSVDVGSQVHLVIAEAAPVTSTTTVTESSTSTSSSTPPPSSSTSTSSSSTATNGQGSGTGSTSAESSTTTSTDTGTDTGTGSDTGTNPTPPGSTRAEVRPSTPGQGNRGQGTRGTASGPTSTPPPAG